jgi:predicted nuclease of predicted toxin-antitoxin system
VKLLFEHNLSPRLVLLLADLFPDCSHVALVGLSRALDDTVWTYAHAEG